MNRIQQQRKEIDRLDAALLRLLNRRAHLAIAISKLKKREGLPLSWPSRERDVLLRVAESNCGPLDGHAVERLFRMIIRECRRVQEIAWTSEPARNPVGAGSATLHAQVISK